jgi:hypothetical protein
LDGHDAKHRRQHERCGEEGDGDPFPNATLDNH